MASEPEFLMCLNCDTPTYDFEWVDGQLGEALCATCGNDDIDQFLSETEYEEQSGG
ncbi:MAG TPA: hypothetical protein VM557_01000 [Thermoanaerobaculia bacterium]|nr:hypothetical protein [Thermoanaerobaculia bacterium]